MRVLLAACCLLLLPGCLARTAYDVATLPVRAGSQVVDWTTTSQSEADRNAGRRMRKQKARDEKQAREDARRQRKAAKEQARRGGAYPGY